MYREKKKSLNHNLSEEDAVATILSERKLKGKINRYRYAANS